MYVPYLYARQGECKAVEDVAPSLGSPQKVFPLFEPVVDNVRDLIKALAALSDRSASSYVILNPSRYRLATRAAQASWLANMGVALADPLVRPTFEIRPGVTLADLTAFVSAHSGKSMGVSIRGTSISASDVSASTTGEDVLHFLHAAADPTGYASGIGAKRTIEVRDSFRREVRNADYSGEEQFTTAHQHFTTSGHAGFSDYTLLPGTFNASGGPLGAAVIHMSFVNPADGSLWVQHFVSDETRQHQSTQPAKLFEAMTKLQAQVAATPGRFEKSPGHLSFQAQFAARTPTSPTYNKRQQISHNIFTTATVV